MLDLEVSNEERTIITQLAFVMNYGKSFRTLVVELSQFDFALEIPTGIRCDITSYKSKRIGLEGLIYIKM